MLLVVGITLLLPSRSGDVVIAQEANGQTYVVQPGDTWTALAWRLGTDSETLAAAYAHPNSQRQPPIGAELVLPNQVLARPGTLYRTSQGGMLQLAAVHGLSPWHIAIRNGRASPYRPLLYGPVIVPGGQQPPRDLPPGFETLELSQNVAHPGEVVALRAKRIGAQTVVANLGGISFPVFQNGGDLVALGGTGAFYGREQPELTIQVEGFPPWVQPWRVEDKIWDYQQITLTGAAAAIDQESIAKERARLFALWSDTTPIPLWDQAFRLPIDDYLEISSSYGARRSYNGGPYSSYHEGVDFSAYGGTDVFAPASGTVALAETLYVRGGAVILDHGLGIYTGYYHLSEVSVATGDSVFPGQIIGSVGTSGLSTGNHLHWDLLVNGTWVDAMAWLEQDTACWILIGLGLGCSP